MIMKYNKYWIHNCGKYRQNVCIYVNLNEYRWRNDDGVNLCRRKLDWTGLKIIDIYEYGFKKFVEPIKFQ